MGRRKKLSAVASEGDRRATLECLRDCIAKAIETCDSGRDIAALSRRLMEIEAQLAAIPDPSRKDSPAQAARKRAAARKSDG